MYGGCNAWQTRSSQMDALGTKTHATLKYAYENGCPIDKKACLYDAAKDTEAYLRCL